MSLRTLPSDRPALVVDLLAIRRNWEKVRSVFTGSGVGAVVKQDAYGLGVKEVVPVLLANGCRDFWVADFTEALAVRAVTAHCRIFVLHGLCGIALEEFQRIGAVPVLVDMRDLELACAAAGDSRPEVAIHLDTGLNRLGLELADVRALIADPTPLRRLEVAAYVTHLAHFSNPLARANSWQWRRFLAWARRLPPAPLSFCASSGVFGRPERHADLARVGSAIYGVETTPSRPQPLWPAATLSAPVLRVHEVPAGGEVGYGGAYRAPGRRRLAQLPAGYADGVPFAFREPAHVLIGGYPAPIIATAAMSLMTVDVTDVPAELARPGARAVLFGPELPVDRLAAAAKVAPNVVHVLAGKTVSRFYVNAGEALSAKPAEAEMEPAAGRSAEAVR